MHLHEYYKTGVLIYCHQTAIIWQLSNIQVNILFSCSISTL